MPGEPNYYDSQAAAAAALGVDVYYVKWAKQDGCRAFRSGRVYRAELVEWFKSHPPQTMQQRAGLSVPNEEKNGEAGDYFSPGVFGWKDRLAFLFEIGELLDYAHGRGQISDAEYEKIGNKTIPLIIRLAISWNAEIDIAGYLSRWREIKAKLSPPR